MKVRVHELAKKYDMGNKEFLNLLKDDIKITVSSHLSGLAEEDVKKIDKYFKNINNKEEVIVKPEKTTSNGKGDSLNKKVVGRHLLLRLHAYLCPEGTSPGKTAPSNPVVMLRHNPLYGLQSSVLLIPDAGYRTQQCSGIGMGRMVKQLQHPGLLNELPRIHH